MKATCLRNFLVALLAGLLHQGIDAQNRADLAQLAVSLEGSLHIVNTDQSFDVYSLLWDNLYFGPSPVLPPATPSYYVVALDEEDVVYAAEFALKYQIKVSVVGNGHQFAQTAWLQSALVIDMSNLKEIDVDPENRLITFQPGNTAGEVANATALYNLNFPVAHASGVGMSGFALGGGAGWRGWAVDQLTGFDVVNIWENSTEGLSVVHVNATSYPDLFWGLRGAGQMLGLVTQFYGYLLPLTADNITTTTAIVPAPLASAAFAAVQSNYDELDENVESSVILVQSPQGVVGLFQQYGYVSTDEAAASKLQDGLDVAEQAGAVMTETATTTYEELVVSLDATQDYPNVASFCQSAVIGQMNSTVFEVAVAIANNATSPNSIVGVFGPVYSPYSNDVSAYGWRGYYQIWVWAFWTRTSGGAPVDGDARHIAWAKAGQAALAPYAIGQYLNIATYMNPNDTYNSFPPDHWQSIVLAKKAYDPENLLRELDYYRLDDGESPMDGASDGAVGAANSGTGTQSLLSS